MKINILIAAVSAFFILPSSFGQGALTPPGAPAPTMKSLDQIEARTPVDAVHTPGGANDLFTITSPGSYYLTTNVVGVSGRNGIGISSGGVTLDLNGFSVLGTSGADNGINVANVIYTNVTIRNGTISGWTQAGFDGIQCLAQNATIERVTVSGNGIGLTCEGNGTIVRDCVVSGNATQGIHVEGSGSWIVGNICAGNDAADVGGVGAIHVTGPNIRIERNHVSGSGTAGNGILILSSGIITNNLVIQNSVEGNVTNNYSLGSGNIAGPIITNTAAGIITNSNPWANFSF